MKLRPFELGLVIIFIGLICLSLVFFSVYKKPASNDGTPQIGQVSLWGTLPPEGVNSIIENIKGTSKDWDGVTYTYFSEEEFDDVLVNALADGTGPDAVLVSHERLIELRKRIQPISYESFPLRDIKNIYIDGAQIFALNDGLYAYPLMADPLVMYWNKDILATSNFLEAPSTWEKLVNDYFPQLIQRNPDRSITRSVVAIGEYNNVKNSFGILSMLMLQAGMQGVTSEEDSFYEVKINQSNDGKTEPLRVSADFYTRFAQPNNGLYSWNRSFSSDRDRFLSEELALYFGYGSEGPELEGLNPNLSFDITEVPQGAAATVRRTYARFYGFSALRSSKNLSGASVVMQTLTSKENSENLAKTYAMVPVMKASVAAGSNDTYGRITYKSAGIAYGWLNPDIQATDDILSKMTQDLNENRSDLSRAIIDVLEKLKLEYN